MGEAPDYGEYLGMVLEMNNIKADKRTKIMLTGDFLTATLVARKEGKPYISECMKLVRETLDKVSAKKDN
jgi:hypothetical protein